MLASIGSLEFFYDQAPDVMRSCCMALQLLSVAIGSYLSGALVSSPMQSFPHQVLLPAVELKGRSPWTASA